MKHGLLLLNLGTPATSQLRDVKAYLREFLSDPRVIDLPSPLRQILVQSLIVPFRAKKSAKAYQLIWTQEGSPLLIHSQNLVKRLKEHHQTNYHIVLGMRYGQPSLSLALKELAQCESITILPLYPQYSSAATGSSLEATLKLITQQEILPSLRLIREFYQHPAYIQAQAERIRNYRKPDEYLLFSYHGIPERQIIKGGCHTPCKDLCPLEPNNHSCYKAQCHATTALLAQELGLEPQHYSSSFQSRLGKLLWIKPYTNEILEELAAKGIKKLAIVCPSFVADCLETLEEIGIKAKEQWFKLGGEQFNLIPAMNDSPEWAEAIMKIVSKPMLDFSLNNTHP